MKKFYSEYSSKFRILKGGKISLVVSAMLVSAASMVTPAYATPEGITIDNGDNWSTDLTYVNIAGSSVSVEAEGSAFNGRAAIFGTTQISDATIDITNNANITASQLDYTSTNNALAGIVVGGFGDGSYTTKILNNGQISLAGDEVYGIGADLHTDTSFVKNSGTINIQSIGSGSDQVSVGMFSEYMLGSSLMQNTSTGNITITSTLSTPAILQGMFSPDMSDTSSIQNDGKISIQGIGVDTGFASMSGITAMMTAGSPSIVNNGDIIIKSLETSEIAVGMQAMIQDEVSDASITNNGNIAVSGYGALGGIYVMNTIDNATITNGVNGKIYVNSEEEEPEMFVAIGSSNAAIVNDGIVEATIGGTLNSTTGKIENGVLDASAYSVATMSVSATVTNNATGHLNGNLMVAGNVTNSGTISLPHNANGNMSASIGGDFTNSGTLQIGVMKDGTLENTTHSQLMVGGTATFESGSKINVDVKGASEQLLIGETLHGVVISTTLTDNGVAITDNSTKVNFEKVIDADNPNELDLLIVQGQSYAERAAVGGGNASNQSAAAAAEAKGIDFVGVVDGDDKGFSKAVASTTPVITMAANTANTQIMNGIQGIVEMRQNNVMSGMNSGDLTLGNKNVWTKAYGSKGNQDNKDGTNGFEVDAYGIGIGADAEVSNDSRIGAAFFYTKATINVNDMNQNSDLDVFTAMVYGNKPINQNTNFLYQAGYTWQKTSSERVDYFSDKYTSDFTSKIASIDLKVMQSHKINDKLTVRPLVEATYRHFENPSYTESGTGNAGALSVEDFSSSQLVASAGAISEYKLENGSKVIADLRVGYDFDHEAQSVTSSYGGGYSFATEGIDNGGWQYNAGIGYETQNVLGGEINFSYNYQGQGNSFDNQAISAKYVYKF